MWRSSSNLRNVTKTIWKYIFILGLFAICLVHHAHAIECITASNISNKSLLLRAEPSAKSTAIGKLNSNEVLPLIALMPGWYETRISETQEAYVAKRSSKVVPCPKSTLQTLAIQDAQYELHAIDVGTGLAVFVRGPDFSLQYDAGSNDDTALGEKNRALSYLKTLKPTIETLRHVILSHPHRDHVELLPDIVNELKPNEIWNSGAYHDICSYRNFIFAIAANPRIQYHTGTFDKEAESIEMESKNCYGSRQAAQTVVLNHASKITDERIAIGSDAFMSFLFVDGSRHQSPNENSLVVRLDLGGKRILLMGDAEAGGRNASLALPNKSSIEGKLLNCCSKELKADILVVGHHGSKTSSRAKFLDAVGAKTFIVSSGPTKYSKVILPDQEVLTELEKRGQVFRTDLEDESCLMSPDKVGPDSDNQPGGCDNVLVKISPKKPILVKYNRILD